MDIEPAGLSPPRRRSQEVASSSTGPEIVRNNSSLSTFSDPPIKPPMAASSPTQPPIANHDFSPAAAAPSSSADPPANQQPGDYYYLPPITTDSLPTALQAHIAAQSWDKVSARQPIGCHESVPDGETFHDFASTILETRLTEVVKHRRGVEKLSSSSSGREAPTTVGGSQPHASDDNGHWPAARGGEGTAVGPRPATLPGGPPSQASTASIKFATTNDGDPAASSASAMKQHPSSFPNPPSHPPSAILLSSRCRSQLRAYVRRIASMYRDNRYHGLEHAVHVTMSANKLLDMLHEGGGTGESDDDDGGEVNDFSVSEPCIMRGVNMDKSDHDDSVGSLLSENGYQKSRRVSAAPVRRGALVRRSSFSEDFLLDGRDALRPARPRRPSLEGAQNGPSTTHHHLVYSDPFTKFAFVFAALIHDVDHQGVPNTRLVLENDPIVEIHGGTSTAEKHSIKVAFRTLNEEGFDELRSAVFDSPDDRLQMHRIVKNVVVSTDIASPDRMQTTKIRWEEAFSGSLPLVRFGPARGGVRPLPSPSASEIATVQASKPRLVPMRDDQSAELHATHRQQRRNSLTKRVLQLNGGKQATVEYFPHGGERGGSCHREGAHGLAYCAERAALREEVVVETMLNVADVAHSMQSWELFCFWNRKLFEELYVAYRSGRSGGDPSDGWYENQLGFYRLYVIPLAEKMRTCGVFGERGGEWVKNAISIRDRWCREGEEMTRDMIASVKRDIV